MLGGLYTCVSVQYGQLNFEQSCIVDLNVHISWLKSNMQLVPTPLLSHSDLDLHAFLSSAMLCPSCCNNEESRIIFIAQSILT